MTIIDKLKGAIRQNEIDTKEGRVKRSFWPSDCLKPGIEIFWKWMDVPETNPIQTENLLLMKVGKLYEEAMGEFLISSGSAVKVDEGQARVEYERMGVKITGYMDFVHPDGYPIEIKTTSTFGMARLLKGAPPNDHHLHQLACYIDFMGAHKGVMINAGREGGELVESEIVRKDDGSFECKGYSFRLEPEYKRWQELYTENITKNIQPKLDYEYRPTLTRDLLKMFDDKAIKAAIKGERILSAHRWRPQYCNWKDLWIDLECTDKKLTRDELCAYQPSDVAFMLAYLGREFRTDKSGKAKIMAIKGLKTSQYDEDHPKTEGAEEGAE